jgi:hypothetical protein
MAAGIKSLRGDMLQLQERQADQKKHWLLWSRIGSCVVIVLAIMAVYFNAAFPLTPMRQSTGLLFTMWPLGFVIAAFGYAARPTKKTMSADLRNLVTWVIIVVLLLGLFALLQFRSN